MQLTTLFLILAPVIATVRADCYHRGMTWAPDQVQANNILKELCLGLSGNFGGKETKYGCQNAGSPDKKLEFWVRNNNKKALNLSPDDCVLRLSHKINDCKKGGHEAIAGWSFR